MISSAPTARVRTAKRGFGPRLLEYATTLDQQHQTEKQLGLCDETENRRLYIEFYIRPLAISLILKAIKAVVCTSSGFCKTTHAKDLLVRQNRHETYRTCRDASHEW